MRNIICYNLIVCSYMLGAVAYASNLKANDSGKIAELPQGVDTVRYYLNLNNTEKSSKRVMSDLGKTVQALGNNLPYIMNHLDEMILHVEQGASFMLLLSYLPAPQYLEFLNLYVVKYDPKNKYDQVLLESILGEEELHPYFLSWNYKHKEIRRIFHLLLDKVSLNRGVVERIKNILSGDSYAGL